MIVLFNVRYRNGRCRSLYSNNGGQTWYFDQACEVIADPKHISSA